MTAKEPGIPASVQPVLQDYVQRLQAAVPDLLFGVYLHGSITYEAFCEQASDIDILVITTRRCSTEELARLAQIHAELRTTWPRWQLEVSYIPEADCGGRQPGAAPPHPYHHYGEFVASGIFDFNSPLWADNLWWMVKTHGIALVGPQPAALGIRTSASDIFATSRSLVESYWPQWSQPRVAAHENFFKLRHAIHVDWVVFGTLRSYYTLCERDITSKTGAAEYGLARLPGRWHKLIRETVENRRCPAERGIFTRVRIAVVATLYLRFILRECRRIAGKRATAPATSEK